MKIKVLIIPDTNGKSNLNNRVYTKECLKNITDKVNELSKEDRCLVFKYYKEINDLSDVVGKLNRAELNENGVVAEFETLNTTAYESVKQLIMNDEVVFRPRGMGEANLKTKEIENYELQSINMILKEDDAFEQI